MKMLKGVKGFFFGEFQQLDVFIFAYFDQSWMSHFKK
jgi:hypothetical protein